MIASSAPEFGNGIAIISTAVYEKLVLAELEKLLRKVLDSGIDHLVGNLSQPEPHLAVEPSRPSASSKPRARLIS